jgi:hypothetical protein
VFAARRRGCFEKANSTGRASFVLASAPVEYFGAFGAKIFYQRGVVPRCFTCEFNLPPGARNPESFAAPSQAARLRTLKTEQLTNSFGLTQRDLKLFANNRRALEAFHLGLAEARIRAESGGSSSSMWRHVVPAPLPHGGVRDEMLSMRDPLTVLQAALLDTKHRIV